MVQYKLVTYMRRSEPSSIGPPERHIPLPPEIKIYTSYNSWFRDGLWETRVVGINPDGKNSLMQLYATLAPPDNQHRTIVDYNISMGYKIPEQPDSDAVRQPNIDNKLKGLLEASGLGHLLWHQIIKKQHKLVKSQ